MDRLDILSLVVILILIASITFISLGYKSEAGSNRDFNKKRVVVNSEIPPEKLDAIKAMIAANSMKKADAIVAEMLEKYPYEGGPHMLKGDIMMRKQDPVAAIYSYRAAVELEPDYVDKKTQLFQGRKIKVAVDEVKTIIDRALVKDPADGEMKKARKTMYYLLRSLAGSCG
jgi:hypothetical protein